MASAVPDLPYRAEYAKSNRSSCKTCKAPIAQAELRIAVMVQSRHFDGKQPLWHHTRCFFTKQKPKSVGDIAHFDSLRWEDQESLKKKIGAGSGGRGSSTSSSGSKINMKDFKVEYAISGGAKCVACEEKIPKGDVRIGQKDYESETALMYGALDRWRHVDCFVKVREAIQFFEAGSKISGYKDLDKEDKEMLQKKLPAISAGKRKTEDSTDSKPSKKAKTEVVVKDEKAVEKAKDEKKAKEQNKKMFAFRDKLQRNYGKKDFVAFLEYNKQEVPVGVDRILDRLTDVMTFGALLPCKVCKNGQYVYRSGVGYQCMGHLTEFTSCGQINQAPERTVFKVPKDYKDDFKEKFEVGKRFIPINAVTATATSSKSGAVFTKLNPKPLKDLKICFVGDSKGKDMDAMKEKVKQFGGAVRSNISDTIALLVAVTDDVEKEKTKLNGARTHKIPLVSSEFMNRISEAMVVSEEIKKALMPICDWVKPNDISAGILRLNPNFEKKEEKIKEAKMGTETKVKLKMKGGAVVDPESGMEDTGHVLKVGSTFYNCVLNHTDVDTGRNAYYKLQIIKSDKKNEYFVFRAWGRIGTTIGGTVTSDSLSYDEAIELFHKHYAEKTQNEFGKKFVKKPGCYLPMDIDYGNEETLSKLVPSKTESKLNMAIQELICLICDVDNMKSALLEFELDTEKMPLGKLSRKQILKAYGILNEALELVNAETKKPALERLLADASNRFYTLIPHNFGTSLPTVMDNDAILKSKLEMLESLMEIELAYELLHDDGDKKGGSLVDKHYAKLNTELSILEAKSKEYAAIQKYLENTHASTHDDYKLDIEGIFKVTRKGETARFEKFSKMENRKLLWHGSRTTNYVGILSQGLRIAPPEAPVTGYMFGKGIYFADMVSKSANYCFTSPQRTTGLLMLCEVALGKMYEVKTSKGNLTKAPANFDSVKGLGQTHPDPNEKLKFSNGVEIPYGKPVPSKVDKSELLYNEYIVYDPAQVKIRYLLKCNFKYEGRRRR